MRVLGDELGRSTAAIVRPNTGDDGESHMEELDLDFKPTLPPCTAPQEHSFGSSSRGSLVTGTPLLGDIII